MKKSRIFVSAMALAIAAACSKEQPAVTPVPAVSDELVTISVSAPGADSKVSLTPAEGDVTTLITAWQEGDVLVISDAANTVSSEFTLVEGAGTKFAKFTGKGITAEKYNIAYSADTYIPVHLQAKDGDASHIKYSFALKGVNTLNDIQFNKAWAAEAGEGTFTVSSVLLIQARFAEGVASTITGATVTYPSYYEGDREEIKIVLETPGDEGGDNNINFYVTVPAIMPYVAAGDIVASFESNNADHSVYTRYFNQAEPFVLLPGKVNGYILDCTKAAVSAGKDDDGTEAHPYIVADKYQLDAMHSVLADDKVVYIKQVADIDLAGIDWAPFNNEGSFGKGIVYDGGNHTISNLTSGNVQYASFAGVLNGTVANVTFDGAKITGTSKAGVVAGYIGSNGANVEGNCENVIVKNAELTGSVQGLAAFAGVIDKSNYVRNCHVNTATVTSSADRVGGFVGQVRQGINISDCSANNVTVKGTVNIGGFVGVGYGIFTNCTSSGTVDSINDVKDQDIALGGFAGYFENGLISKCSSSVSIDHATRGRDIGGFVGKMLVGTIEKSFATGKARGTQRNVGGFAGLITNTSSSSIIRNCYCTGNVEANGYVGGFVGLVEKGAVTISSCYSSSNVVAEAFAAGGLVGVQSSAACAIEKCAAWNSSVTAGSIGSNNWSSGAVIGVCFPTCTVTNTYRNPGMSLTAYWVPEAYYDHPDVSSDHPLVKQNGAETTATSTASSQDGYPIFPYHGHVYFDFEKTLSMLAFSTLIWSSDIWDLSNDLPTLY